MPTLPTRLPPDDVRRWIEQQDASEQAELSQTWVVVGLAAEPSRADTEAAWAHLDELLGAVPSDHDAMQVGLRAWQQRDALDTAAPGHVRSFLLTHRPIIGAVALAATVIVAALVWVRPVTVQAGETVLAVALPDGSGVTLAPGTEIAYRRSLRGDSRRVELEGQAYFDVASDGRSFVVETFNATVEVLGTAFDVQTWGGTETTVALVEGSVTLSSELGASVVLKPGEVSRVVRARAPTSPHAVDSVAVTAWQGGAFSVVDAPLAAVAVALGARAGRPVRLSPDVDGARRLTLYVPATDSVEFVLRDLAAYLDLHVRATSEGYLLSR